MDAQRVLDRRSSRSRWSSARASRAARRSSRTSSPRRAPSRRRARRSCSGRSTAGPGSPSPTDAVRRAARPAPASQLREIERARSGHTARRAIPRASTTCASRVRRSRALLRAGKALVATDTTELDARLQGLGRVLGDVRDLDVLLERLEARRPGSATRTPGTHGRCSTRFARERKRCRRRLMTLSTVDRLPLATRRHRADARGARAERIGCLPRRSSPTGVREGCRRPSRKLPDEPADEELHAVRKKGKRARYAGRACGAATGSSKQAKLLQDVLGEHQDCGRRGGAAARARRAGAAGAGARGRPPRSSASAPAARRHARRGRRRGAARPQHA